MFEAGSNIDEHEFENYNTMEFSLAHNTTDHLTQIQLMLYFLLPFITVPSRS